MKILLIGFCYRDVEQIQDRLMKEIPQLQLDFAISIRDGWYRSNLSECDYIVAHISDRMDAPKDMIRDMIDRCNGAQLIFFSHEDNIEVKTGLDADKPLIWLTKNTNYIEQLAALLQNKLRDIIHSEQRKLSALPEVEADAPYLLPTIQASFDPMLIINSRLQIVATNEAFLTQFQQSNENVLGKSCCEVLGRHFDSYCMPGSNCIIREVIRTKTILQTNKVGNSEVDKFAVRASPMRSQHSENEYVVVSLHQTLSPNVAGQTYFNRSLLEQLLSGLSDGVLFCNAEHRVIVSNLAAETIIGKRKLELLNRSILDLPFGDAVQWLKDGLNSLKAGIRFNSIASNTLINNQKVQIRFAPIFGLGECYLGGFLYITEVEEFLPIEPKAIMEQLSDQNFEVLRLPSPGMIAEG